MAFVLSVCARLTRKRVLFHRSFASAVEVSTPTLAAAPPESTWSQPLPKVGRLPVREDHGLYGFFRRKEGSDLKGDARYETMDSPEHLQKTPTGRSWRASELRLKSFQDLHTLWYILLRERNLLATQKEETRRMGVTNSQFQVSGVRVHQCRKSMARIKAVLNERRLAFEGAVKLAEAEKEGHEDELILQEQQKLYKRERQYLVKRRERHARIKAAREAKHSASQASSQGDDVVVDRLTVGVSFGRKDTRA